jgi:parallel beta-helix repeat protein
VEHRRHFYARRGTFRLAIRTSITVLALAAWGAPERAAAKDCGGSVTCECGDRVVASTQLHADLNSCGAVGLRVAAGILDCDGRQLAGPGDRTDSIGIAVIGSEPGGPVGLEVRNCRVRNFGRGIEIKGGSGNRIVDNVLFDNEVGLWAAGASAANSIARNYVHDNRDEGIHLGAGAQLNAVTDNVFANNRAENVYLLEASRNVIRGNTLQGAKAAAIFVKNASGNEFTDNSVLDRNILLRGDSDANVFSGNVLMNGAFALSAIEEASGWRHPNGNSFLGGRIEKASTCFEFVGAYDNTAAGVIVDTCSPVQEKPAGGLVPHGNVVSVVREDIDDAASGDRRTGNLRKARSPLAPDRFKLDLRNVAWPTDLNPVGQSFGCVLAGPDGLILTVEVPTGVLAAAGEGVRLTDPTGAYGGLTRLDLRRAGTGRWRIRLTGRAVLGEVRMPLLNLQCHVGNQLVEFSDLWAETRRGWRLRVQP